MVLIKIYTKSREKQRLKHREDSNQQPLDKFDHALLPENSLASLTSTAEYFSMYT